MFKRLFGQKETAAPANALAMVRNISVGRTVSLNRYGFCRLLKRKLSSVRPSTQPVAAVIHAHSVRVDAGRRRV